MRDLFEACKSGDIHRIKSLVDSGNVNAKDTAGRRSSPLHFSAGDVIQFEAGGGRHDTQHNDILPNDTQHNDILPNDAHHKYI